MYLGCILKEKDHNIHNYSFCTIQSFSRRGGILLTWDAVARNRVSGYNVNDNSLISKFSLRAIAKSDLLKTLFIDFIRVL